VAWFVNLFVHAILWTFRIPEGGAGSSTRLTPEEMRTAVLESGSFIRGKHRSLLLNVFDLEQLTVDDVMAPRAAIEALDIEQPISALLDQLTSCYHNKLIVYESDISRVLGVLHVRKILAVLSGGPLSHEAIRELLTAPYYIPTGTALLQQLQMFQENRQRLGLVVDEYGELVGLVTVDDIVEEIRRRVHHARPGHGSIRPALGTVRTDHRRRRGPAQAPEPAPRPDAAAGRAQDAERADPGAARADTGRAVLPAAARLRAGDRAGAGPGGSQRAVDPHPDGLRSGRAGGLLLASPSPLCGI